MNTPAEQVRPADVTSAGAVTAPVDGPFRALNAIDLSWASISYTRSVTGIDLAGADRVRDALLAVARRSPEIGRWVTGDQRRWRPVAADEWDRWIAHAFAASDERGADPERVAALNDAAPVSTPFRIMAGPDWLSARMFHSVGDGWTVNSVLRELLTRSALDDVESRSLPWTVLTQRERDRVIARDVRSHFGTLLWALRHRGELAGGIYEPAGADVALGREATFELVGEPGLPAVLRRLRDEFFPGVSAAVMSTVALRAAVRAAVAEPQPGFECLFNTRDEASGTATAFGNFSAGVYLHPRADYDPFAVAEEMRRVRTSGLPALGHASLRLRGRRAGDVVSMPRRAGAPRLTMSYLQGHNMDPFLPGLRQGETRVGTVSRPNGADSVTMQVVECAGRLNVAVSHFPHVWPAAGLRSAVENFLADPHSILSELRAAL